MPRPTGCHRSRTVGTRLFDAQIHGKATDQGTECAISVDAAKGRSLGEDGDVGFRIGDSRAQLSNVAGKAVGPMAVDAAQIRLDQRMGDESGVGCGDPFVGTGWRLWYRSACLRQPH